MVNNKNKTLNNVKSELSKKKRGNPNFVKKQNKIIKEVEINDFEISNSEIKETKENKEEVIETMSSDQIINNNNENNNEINENNEVDGSDEANGNIVITDDDYGDDNNNTNENLDTINTSQETNNKKVKKNSSLYELLSRPFGATMEELEKELNWKKASIRGTISNLQKEQQFCLITINVIKPNFEDNLGYNLCSNKNKSFYKETRYFIKDCEFNLFNDLLNNLPNPEMASIPAC